MLFWLDLETTGLNPQVDHIVEIGLVVTDDDLNRIAFMQSAIQLDYPWPEDIDPYVLTMHGKNGLWDECQSTRTTLEQAKDSAVAFVLQLIHNTQSENEKRILAGSSVHFDRAFLARWMPDLHSLFDYRHIDVSSLKELARRWAPEVLSTVPAPSKKHRVIADIEDSIAELKHYRQHFFNRAVAIGG